MKKYLLLITVLFSSLSVFSQNGWNAYVANYTNPFMPGQETCLAIDKAGNKWIGFTNSLPNSPAAVAKYNIIGGFWNYYCSTNEYL